MTVRFLIFKNDALAKAKITKAYNYLTLTSWFEAVCIQPEDDVVLAFHELVEM